MPDAKIDHEIDFISITKKEFLLPTNFTEMVSND